MRLDQFHFGVATEAANDLSEYGFADGIEFGSSGEGNSRVGVAEIVGAFHLDIVVDADFTPHHIFNVASLAEMWSFMTNALHIPLPLSLRARA